MLYGELKDFTGAMPCCKALKTAVDFLLKAPSLEDGRHELESGMYAEVKHYSPKPEAERSYESHVKYVDVQCVLEGAEVVLIRPLDGMEVKEAYPERDLTYYREPAKGPEFPTVLRQGLFVVLFPRDGHKTECFTDTPHGRKVIIKVPAELMAWR